MLATKEKKDVAELWFRYKEKRDYQAREQLILHYASMVKYVAGRLSVGLPKNVDKDDLISYGIFGLLDAIEKFDPRRGLKFETYAIARIRGSIWDGLRAMDWVPPSVRQKAKELEQVYSRLDSLLGRAATDREVCEAMGLEMDEFYRLLAEVSATTLLSLDEYWTGEGGEDGLRLIDSLQDSEAEDPLHNLEYSELKDLLAQAIEKLTEKERHVVTLYYYEGLTLREIGAVLNLTESRISQLHTKAILRLRGSLSRKKKQFF